MTFSERTPRVFEVALTGGPCSGKSSSLARLPEKVTERTGFPGLVIPELATQLIAGGVPIVQLAQTDRDAFLAVEEQMLLHVQEQRLRYRRIAEAMVVALGTSVVIYADRGPMDICTYTGRDAFESILEANELTYHDVRDSIDLVVHMVSTAVDLPELYSSANNAARYETVEQAAEIDAKGVEVWTGANLVVVGNDTDFETKLSRVEQAVLSVVAGPAPRTVQRKFLLDGAPDFDRAPLKDAQRFDIEQTYLRSDDPDVERSVRLRVHDGHGVHIYTVKRPAGDGSRETLQARITRAEYRRLLADADPDCQTVRKTRRVFVSGQLVWKVDSLAGDGPHVAEVELPADFAADDVTAPAGLQVLREVTGETAYLTRELAAV